MRNIAVALVALALAACSRPNDHLLTTEPPAADGGGGDMAHAPDVDAGGGDMAQPPQLGDMAQAAPAVDLASAPPVDMAQACGGVGQPCCAGSQCNDTGVVCMTPVPTVPPQPSLCLRAGSTCGEYMEACCDASGQPSGAGGGGTYCDKQSCIAGRCM